MTNIYTNCIIENIDDRETLINVFYLTDRGDYFYLEFGKEEDSQVEGRGWDKLMLPKANVDNDYYSIERMLAIPDGLIPPGREEEYDSTFDKPLPVCRTIIRLDRVNLYKDDWVDNINWELKIYRLRKIEWMERVIPNIADNDSYNMIVPGAIGHYPNISWNAARLTKYYTQDYYNMLADPVLQYRLLSELGLYEYVENASAALDIITPTVFTMILHQPNLLQPIFKINTLA